MTCDLTVPIPPAAKMLQCCHHTNTKTCPFARQTVVSFIYTVPAYEQTDSGNGWPDSAVCLALLSTVTV